MSKFLASGEGRRSERSVMRRTEPWQKVQHVKVAQLESHWLLLGTAPGEYDGVPA
jgi:hypothetical protein